MPNQPAIYGLCLGGESSEFPSVCRGNKETKKVKSKIAEEEDFKCYLIIPIVVIIKRDGARKSDVYL